MSAPRICFLTSEVTPFAKAGGLADVSAALPKVLHRSGHDIRVFLPLYSVIDRQAYGLRAVEGVHLAPVVLGQETVSFSLFETSLPGSTSPVYFVDCPRFYDRPVLYTDDDDEFLRFVFLALAAMESCRLLSWIPDIIHCNDWQGGLVPIFLKLRSARDRRFRKTRTVFTIHNLGYQGIFSSSILEVMGLNPKSRSLPRDDIREGRIGFLKTGLMNSDFVTTVSPTYAKEIQTQALGMGLHDILRRRRGTVQGIVNGVDTEKWNPRTDSFLDFRYSARSLWRKEKNKEALLSMMGLSYRRRVPTFGIVARLTYQKGFDLLEEPLAELLEAHDIRFVVLGSGEKKYERIFTRLCEDHPTRAAFYCGYHEELAHKIEGGCDFFLMPSIYEPCGLNQMYSLLYGTIPIVRKTGGLADTVQAFDPATGQGNGVVFEPPTPEAVSEALETALSLHASVPVWKRVMANAMSADFSWERPAQQYADLYRQIIQGATAEALG